MSEKFKLDLDNFRKAWEIFRTCNSSIGLLVLRKICELCWTNRLKSLWTVIDMNCADDKSCNKCRRRNDVDYDKSMTNH